MAVEAAPSRSIFKPGTASEIRTPLFGELLDWWRTTRGDRPIPARRDFLAEDLVRWWKHLALYQVQPTESADRDRYKFVYHGLKPMEYDGGDFTGRFLDESLPARMYGFTETVYREVCRRRVPIYTLRNVVGQSGFPVIYERLVLPLSSDGVRVDMLLTLLERRSTRDLPQDMTPPELDQAGKPFEAESLVALAFDD